MDLAQNSKVRYLVENSFPSPDTILNNFLGLLSNDQLYNSDQYYNKYRHADHAGNDYMDRIQTCRIAFVIFLFTNPDKSPQHRFDSGAKRRFTATRLLQVRHLSPFMLASLPPVC